MSLATVVSALALLGLTACSDPPARAPISTSTPTPTPTAAPVKVAKFASAKQANSAFLAEVGPLDDFRFVTDSDELDAWAARSVEQGRALCKAYEEGASLEESIDRTGLGESLSDPIDQVAFATTAIFDFCPRLIRRLGDGRVAQGDLQYVTPPQDCPSAKSVHWKVRTEPDDAITDFTASVQMSDPGVAAAQFEFRPVGTKEWHPATVRFDSNRNTLLGMPDLPVLLDDEVSGKHERIEVRLAHFVPLQCGFQVR